MEKRRLGQTDIEVSPIGLGTVKFGRNVGVKYPAPFEIPTEAALARLLDVAQDLGVNLLDTAPAYGESEVRLGRLLRGRRDAWIIVGKAGEEFADGVSTFDFSPANFTRSLERSLKRLGTDYLDVLLIHSDGHDTRILADDDLIAIMQSFKQRGLVRAIGASTKTVAGGLAALDRLDTVMVAYNQRYTEERPVLNEAVRRGKRVLIKKGLASGHLGATGGADPVGSAIRFALAHDAVASVIVGTINPEHLKQNIAAAAGPSSPRPQAEP